MNNQEGRKMLDISGKMNEVIGQVGAILKHRLAMLYSPFGLIMLEKGGGNDG